MAAPARKRNSTAPPVWAAKVQAKGAKPAPPPPVGIRGPKKLFPWQTEAVEFFKRHKWNALLCDSQGTGKTVSVCASIRASANVVAPIIIVSPASVVESWKRHTTEWVPWARPTILESSRANLPPGRNIFILSWDMLYRWATRLARMQPKLIVADEIHTVRNGGIQRARAFAWLCRRTPMKIGLSGTPIVNTAEDLAQIQSYFGRRPPLLRRLLADVHKSMPPKRRAYIDVALPEALRAEYRQAEDDFEGWLRARMARASDAVDDKAMARTLAAEALVKTGHLRRIIGRGKVYGGLDFVSRMVRSGEPVVVFCEHQEVIELFTRGLQRMRISHAVLSGSTRRKDRVAMIDAFQDRGELAVLICTQAGKEGITLHRACHALILERQWTSAVEEQEEDRIWRLGQLRPVTIHILRVQRTFDMRMDEIVRSKEAILDAAIGGQQVATAEEAAVLALIREWDRQALQPESKTATLGVTHKPLAAFPRVAGVHKFVFGPRWGEAKARAWMTMMHYPVMRVMPDSRGAIHCIVRGNGAFRPSGLKVQRLARDLLVVTGPRLR